MQEYINLALKKDEITEVNARVQEVEMSLVNRSAWRVEGTLREYPKFPPLNLWFEYPIHKVDEVGVLADVDPEGMIQPVWSKNISKKKTPEERKKERQDELESAYFALDTGEEIKIKDIAEYLQVTEKTIRNRIKEHGGFWIEEGIVGKKG